jgi:hypothetical protein
MTQHARIHEKLLSRTSSITRPAGACMRMRTPLMLARPRSGRTCSITFCWQHLAASRSRRGIARFSIVPISAWLRSANSAAKLLRPRQSTFAGGVSFVNGDAACIPFVNSVVVASAECAHE